MTSHNGEKMNKRRLAILILTIVALYYVTFLIIFANISYPLVGGDFSYFIPRMLDTFQHYKINGFSIQWYTPSFGGGLPAYPNPQNMQFSLSQLLVFLVNPWVAILAGWTVCVVIGFYSAYYFFEHILKFTPFSSAIGSILFNVNGFVIGHMVIGHVTFQTFPLYPLLLIAFTAATLNSFSRGLFISLVFAVLVYSGGFYIAVIYLLSFSVTVPLLLLIKPDVFRPLRIIPSILWTLLLTVLLTGSKIYASMSFLEFFPRILIDHYNISFLKGIFGVFLQFTLVPYFLGIALLTKFSIINPKVFNITLMTGAPYGLWEFDMSQPISFLIILIMMFFFFLQRLHKGQIPKLTKRVYFLLILLVFFTWITLEFRLTNGWVYPAMLSNLPIIRSLHVNLRYSAALIFPFALFGAFSFNYFESRIYRCKTFLFLFLSLLSIVHLVNYYSLDTKRILDYSYDISPLSITYKDISQGRIFPIKYIAKVSDSKAIEKHESSALPYEPIFGYGLEHFKSLTHPGPVWDQENGYFNMTNPSSLVFPKENNAFVFERIQISDKKKLEDFTHHRQPAWQRPLIQKVLDYLLLSSFAIFLLFLMGILGKRIKDNLCARRNLKNS